MREARIIRFALTAVHIKNDTMNKSPYTLLILTATLITTPALAAKPDSVINKPNKEMIEKHQSKAEEKAQRKQAKEAAREAKDDAAKDHAAKDDEETNNKANKSSASDKTDAERKEAGRGSETGQQKRAENSRKWWKFWQ